MEVLTGYPVYIDKKRVGKADNQFIYANGAIGALQRTAQQLSTTTPASVQAVAQTQAEKGKIWDKISGKWRDMTQNEQSTFNRLKSSGAFAALGQFLGLTPAQTTQVETLSTEKEKTKEGLTTTQWLLIGGGVLVVGTLIFFATRKK